MRAAADDDKVTAHLGALEFYPLAIPAPGAFRKAVIGNSCRYRQLTSFACGNA
jgi:hypothetical protein